MPRVTSSTSRPLMRTTCRSLKIPRRSGLVSAVQVLKAFMKLGNMPDGTTGASTDRYLFWLVGIHIVFVLSGLALAWTDKIGDAKHAKGH